MLDNRNEEHIKELFRLLNYMGNDEKYAEQLAEIVKKEHKTLQQNFIRTMKLVIAELSKIENTDARNKEGIDWCKEVAKIESHLSHI